LPPDAVTVPEYAAPVVAVAGALLVSVSAAPQATVNAATFEVAVPGLVMTIDPDPVALVLVGL
jgi:hypothetical protein